MCAKIAYMINLHLEGKISDGALDKALNALQPAQNVKPVEKKETSSDTAIAKEVRARRRIKNKAKTNKIAELKKNVIKESEEVSEAKETKSNLKLVDRSICNYFKTYEIDAHKYKDTFFLFDGKNRS